MKKGVVVWIFGFLTFFACLHAFDAVLSLAPERSGSLLELYPFYGKLYEVFGEIKGIKYFWISLISTFAFLGVTCSVAFYDPVVAYIKKVVSETKLEDSQADPSFESGLTALAMINDSLTSNSITLREFKNDLNTLRDGVAAIKADVTRLSGKMGELETDLAKLRKCPSCGKSILPQFQFCPYCGEELSLYVLIRKQA